MTMTMSKTMTKTMTMTMTMWQASALEGGWASPCVSKSDDHYKDQDYDHGLKKGPQAENLGTEYQ